MFIKFNSKSNVSIEIIKTTCRESKSFRVDIEGMDPKTLDVT